MNRVWKWLREVFTDDGSFGRIQAAHIRRLIFLWYRKR